MRLKAAARRFDRLVFADAYNPATTFKGQWDVFDDSRRDGMTIERRILSVAPEVSMPTRRTVKADGLTWLIGDHHRDYYRDEAIRHKYVSHQASELVAAKTFAEAIGASAGYQAWASRVWVKGAKEVDTSSQITNVFDIYFAPGETLAEGTLVSMSGRWLLIRSLYPSTAGLLVALADELPEPVQVSVTFDRRVFQPLTGDYVNSPLVVNAIRLHWQSYFRYPLKGVVKYQSGDIVLMVRKTDVTPTMGDKVTLLGESYTVDGLLDEGLCWSLHLRNV